MLSQAVIHFSRIFSSLSEAGNGFNNIQRQAE
jgi:hypothetical protein